MSKVEIKINSSGIRELLKSAGAKDECMGYANRIFSQVSNIDGYVMEERNYRERSGYVVTATDYPAIGDNLKHNTLLKVSQI